MPNRTRFRIKNSFFFLLSLFIYSNIWSQSEKYNGDSVPKRLTAEEKFLSQPSFTIFNDNYFMTGTTLREAPSKYNSDVKYQISFKQLLYRNPLVAKSFLFVSYTQKSFWDIYKNSKPFAEINFNPALGLIRPYDTKTGKSGFFTLMLEHESNGRDSIQSRSWNFFSAGWQQNISDRVQLNAKVWLPFAYKDDNPDLINYVGYGQFGAAYIIKPSRWYADVLVKKGNQWNWKGSVMGQLYYKPFKKGNQFIGIQWFQGYGENLISYQQKTSMVRIGLLIKPNLTNFFY